MRKNNFLGEIDFCFGYFLFSLTMSRHPTVRPPPPAPDAHEVPAGHHIHPYVKIKNQKIPRWNGKKW
jgi:hypothetical protein